MLSTGRRLPLVVAAAALSCAALASPAAAYVGGHDALKDKPFVTGLRPVGGTTFFCTATLLHAEWVLTAAHCVDGTQTAAGLELVIGDTTLDDTTDPAQTRYADRIVLHEDWDGDSGDENDVALIHLSTPSTLPTVRLGITPALADGVRRCAQLAGGQLQQQTLFDIACPSGRGKALGWGRRSMSDSGTSRVLREVTPKIFGGPRRGFWRAKSGACPGDSGGPLLVLAADGTPRQIGVASYNQHGGGIVDWLVGDQCSSKGHDFYSDVAGTLRPWIEATTRIRDHRS